MSEILRGVYPERRERAQNDSEWAQDDSLKGAALAQAERRSALRLPPFRREVRHHRFAHLRQDWRGRVMVEVNHERIQAKVRQHRKQG